MQSEVDMTAKFNVILATEKEGKVRGDLTRISSADLPKNDVLVDVAYSSLNYKDALAISGRSRICRKLPLILGIDLAGTVIESKDDRFKSGDQVLINGFKMGEIHDGGYSQIQSAQGDWLVQIPEKFSLHDVMAIGTAGLTAMLCVMALEDAAITPDKGKVLVTGAGGGVGSLAITLLSKLGYQVTASSGRAELHDYFISLGAAEIIDRNELNHKPLPLETERWAGAADTVGGMTLSNILSKICHFGAVAMCGMVGGTEFTASVMPMILRSVKIIGVNSTHIPRERRLEAWDRLSKDLNIEKLHAMTKTVPMTDITEKVDKMLAGQVTGRVVVDVNS
jgi:putative YhdH/YhfP family quinone oxidoreductase